MKLFLSCFTVSILLLFAACSQQAPIDEQVSPPEPALANPFDGAWEFFQLETPDGPSTTQRGMMVVSGDYVCHVRVQKEREAIAEDDSEDVGEQKAAALFNSTTAACGSYQIEGDTLTANWTTSSDPNVEGHSTDFILTQEGDRVILAPAANPQFKFVYERLN